MALESKQTNVHMDNQTIITVISLIGTRKAR